MWHVAIRLDLRLAVGLLLGGTAAMALPQALPAWLCWSVIVAGLPLLACVGWRLVAAFAIGLVWAVLVASWGMAARLPPALEGADLLVRGRIVDLPRVAPDRLQFGFAIEHGEGLAQPLAGRRVRLSWYRSAVVPSAGSRWQLQVRLKRPRGTLNPGGFDFERHALEQGLVATGYVREGPENIELAAGGGVDGLRARLSNAIAAAVAAPSARFVQALAVGDTRALDQDDWQVLRATGIAHLIAISGLHIGFVAGLGALLMRGWYRWVPSCGLYRPLPQMAALAALLLATAYTALAGFGLPAFRTLLMIAAALLAVLLRRASHPRQAFALALIVVWVLDPLAVLNAGFWLSFLGVAWLLWCLPQTRDVAGWRVLLSAQGVMSLGLLPLTVWFFGQASVVGPACNLLAVPWVSVVVVPITLLGTALELCFSGAGTYLFQLAAWLMQGLWSVLEPVSAWHGALVYLPTPSVWCVMLAALGALIVLLPRGIPGKPMAWLLFAPLVLPSVARPPTGAIDVDVLDVGQGLSVLVRSAQHTLVFDAGPALGEHFDMGEMAVVPSLRALGVPSIDLLIVSHDDNDHAGGAAAIKHAYAALQTVVSRVRAATDEVQCEAGMHWSWDGLGLRVLHPPRFFPYLKNESSCVLRIEAQGRGLALLPGDISSLIEGRLLRESGDDLKSLALVVPHHGSRSSSSEAFIDAVTPTVAMIGSGYRNRFDLPRAEVVQRYRARAIELFDTARNGAIHLRIDASGVREYHTERERRRALWREP
jgi:competence protein ComEC